MDLIFDAKVILVVTRNSKQTTSNLILISTVILKYLICLLEGGQWNQTLLSARQLFDIISDVLVLRLWQLTIQRLLLLETEWLHSVILF